MEKEKETHSLENGEEQQKCPFASSEDKSDENTDAAPKVDPVDADKGAEESGASNALTGLGQFAAAKIETVKENLKAQSLTSDELNSYCAALFKFKTIRVMRFK